MQRVACILAVIVTVLMYTSAASASSTRAPLIASADAARVSTWSCQDSLHLERSITTYSYRSVKSKAYRRWALKLWRSRSSACVQKYHSVMSDPKAAICLVFGSRCGEALRVARCESRFDTGAQNGQYLGLFQMGSNERALYGHGSTPLEQARAAHRYFVASGSDWSPWSCKPWW